jgi:hypothetical protein
MPAQPKPKKPGRPKLPKGAAKGKTVQVRFSTDDLKRVTAQLLMIDMLTLNWPT